MSLSLAGFRESVFFDLDGVLIRSHLAIVRCLNETLQANGLPRYGEKEALAMIGSPVKEVFERIAAAAGKDEMLAAKCLTDFRRAYEKSFMDGTTLQVGIREVVEKVSRSVPIAVATTKPAQIADSILESLRLRSYFTIVAGAAAEGERKEATLARALKEVSLARGATVDARKSLMVGDRHHDIGAARSNEMPVVGVLWGYGSSKELAEADAIVENTEQLLGLIEHGIDAVRERR